MKYVTDHFTLEMIKENKYNIKIKTLKKYQFKEKIKKAKSSINSNLIAKMLHKPKEKNNIELKKGDEIYIVTGQFGRKHSSDYRYNKKFRFEVFEIN